MIDEHKYIVFNREEFLEIFQGTTPLEIILPLALADAVVIRRQDLFAGPALHTYSASIGIAAKVGNLPELIPVADYFHTQAVLADEEGWKVPD